MPYEFVFYPDPPSAQITVTPDSGGAYTSVPYTYTDGRQGQCAYIADTTPENQGALLTIAADGFAPVEMRGFLRLYAEPMAARLEVDDYKLQPSAAPGPTPPPVVGGNTPLEIINNVYATGQYNLRTHDGCGLFTEACCTSIHVSLDDNCGHIKKTGAQNQFNGHAVDAIQFRAGEYYGVWDIITSSVSADAKPAFNGPGDADPTLWFYPAAPITGAQHSRTVVVVPDQR